MIINNNDLSFFKNNPVPRKMKKKVLKPRKTGDKLLIVSGFLITLCNSGNIAKPNPIVDIVINIWITCFLCIYIQCRKY